MKEHGKIRARRMAAARARGRHTESEWFDLLMVTCWSCVRCYGDFRAGEGIAGGLTKDHRLPVSLGGSDAIENIQPLCRSCNSRKGTDPADYLTTFWLKYWGQPFPPTREQIRAAWARNMEALIEDAGQGAIGGD